MLIVSPFISTDHHADQLRVDSITRAAKGMYQCFVRNDHESAQGSAELRLGGRCEYLTHFCPPLRFRNQVPIFAVRETASLGIMGAPRVPPLNPSETIVFSEHECSLPRERAGQRRAAAGGGGVSS